LPRSSSNDLEKWPRVVQLAWSLYDGEGNRESRNRVIIYPADFTIAGDASRIQGITTERAKAEGVSLLKALPQFNADVERAMRVIAHNISFDPLIINTEFLRCRLATNLIKKPHFCTMKAPGIVRYCNIPNSSGTRKKWPTLTEWHLHVFGTDFSGSHDAGADVEACARCYFELQTRGILTWDRRSPTAGLGWQPHPVTVK